MAAADEPRTAFDEQAGRIPLFPLQTVLYPGGLLPLRIFEPRYTDMIGACLRADCGFGVVAIRAGHEVGEPADSFPIGTLARPVDFARHGDGLLAITALGAQRFAVRARRVAPDKLVLGEVEWLPADAPGPLPEEHRYMGDILREVHEAAGTARLWYEQRMDDAGWVSWRIAELLPLPLAERVAVLATDDVRARLALLGRLLDRHAARS